MGKNKKRWWKNPSVYIFAAQVIVSIVFMFQLCTLAMLPGKYFLPLIIGTIIFDVLTFFLMLGRHEKKAVCTIGRIVAIVCVLIMLVANIGMYLVDDLVSDITKDQIQKQGVSLIVMQESNLNAIEDLTAEDIVGIQKSIYRASTDELLRQANEQGAVDIQTVEYTKLMEPVEALYNGDVSAFILDESYRDIVMERYNEFETETRIIYSCSYESEPEIIVEKTDESDEIDVQKDPFTVLITGIDTYGDITTVSRSDVNILMTVNPVTKEVLLTNIPRDYYVPIMTSELTVDEKDAEVDKLTHSGLFGPQCTIRTLENLFDIDIQYYVQVNFSSVINIVDAIGGVTVYNDNAFENFPEGEIYLDGENALKFSRERYAFQSGDRQRGKNQMKVIDAMIKKLSSSVFTHDYMKLISTVKTCVATNMADDEVKALVRMQIDDMASWNVTSTSVDGDGATDFSYYYGDNLYVMYPNQTTVDAAREKMMAVRGSK